MNHFTAAVSFSYTFAVICTGFLAAAGTLLILAGVLWIFRRLMHPLKNPSDHSAKEEPEKTAISEPEQPKIHKPVPDSEAQAIWRLFNRLYKK